jgi:hypothetical protein
MKMQQTKPYWYLLAAFGVASAFVGAACTVNSSTVDSSAGAAGEDTAGSSSAGAGEGGAAAGTGGAASGNAGTAGATAGTGGTDPTTVPACDSGDTPTGTAATSCDSGVTDDCSTCVKAHCCLEYSQCFGTSPGNVCGYGGPNNQGEFSCYQACLQKAFADNGSIGEDDQTACAGSCTTSTASMGALDCGTLGTSTNDLIGCLTDNNCNVACYGG